MKHPEHTGKAQNTSIRSYKHDTGKQVTLVGVMHYSSELDYYPQIQDILDRKEQEGAKIHYESVRPASPAELHAARPATKYLRRVRGLKSLITAPAALMDGLSAIRQKDGIELRPTWENHDASIIQLAEKINPLGLFVVAGIARGASVLMNRLSPEQRLDILNQTSTDIKSDLLHSAVGEAILTYRNDIALSAYDDLQAKEPGRHAALLWGNGHLPGLGEGLEARGFSLMDEQVVVAFDPANISVIGSDVN